jgi:hypothetical protein
MKRKHVENKHGVHTIFLVTGWCKCEFCDNEVRLEKVYCWDNWNAHNSYGCTSCVTSVEHCNIKIDERRALRPKAPKAPPEPPKMRVG